MAGDRAVVGVGPRGEVDGPAVRLPRLGGHDQGVVQLLDGDVVDDTAVVDEFELDLAAGQLGWRLREVEVDGDELRRPRGGRRFSGSVAFWRGLLGGLRRRGGLLGGARAHHERAEDDKRQADAAPAARLASHTMNNSISSTAAIVHRCTTAAAVTVVLMGLGACSTGTGDVAVPESTAQCDSPEFPPVQFGSHLIGDAEPPVPYSSIPPTSGWHASGGFHIAVQPPDQPLRESVQVSIEEAGAVVVTYRDVDEADRQRLEEAVRTRYPSRVAVTSYHELDPGAVVLAAFGVLQRCDGVDLGALDAFVAAYAAEEPAVPGADATPPGPVEWDQPGARRIAYRKPTTAVRVRLRCVIGRWVGYGSGQFDGNPRTEDCNGEGSGVWHGGREG